MTYDGHLIVVSSRGLIAIDRELSGQPQQIRFGDDETVSNSIAVDEKGGIYVASDKIMRKVVWTGMKLSTEQADGAWSAPYDFGRQPPAVKFGIGTGSTPTLMGFGEGSDELVVITDGADHMKLVAFWRNEIPRQSGPVGRCARQRSGRRTAARHAALRMGSGRGQVDVGVGAR